MLYINNETNTEKTKVINEWSEADNKRFEFGNCSIAIPGYFTELIDNEHMYYADYDVLFISVIPMYN